TMINEVSMQKERHKILIVDDTPANIQILNEVLQGDYDIFFATNGPDGIRIAQREEPDLILLDIMMPEMDGYQVCTKIKADPGTCQIPVIFITAMSDEEDEKKGLECGAIDYITKPVSPPIVKSRVKNHLELKGQRDDLKALTIDLGDKNRQLERERTLAHKVLECILPQRFELPGFTTAVMFRPSNQIGGDFLDAWSDGDYTHFLIGDISGHSISAALMMAVSKGIFRSLGYSMTDPVEIVGAANRMLCPMMLDSGMFLTLVYVLFDRRDSSMCVVSAGHNPIYRLDGSRITAIDSTGPAIGWDPEDAWKSVRCRFDPGMRLFLYTDGLTEAKNAAGTEFGEELPSLLALCRYPQACIDRIYAAAEKFSSGEFADDVTIFSIGRD
ncbi:MAG: SpoIIE family protein phosphatase, partial [Desulfuromonadaceae bacterium]